MTLNLFPPIECFYVTKLKDGSTFFNLTSRRYFLFSFKSPKHSQYNAVIKWMLTPNKFNDHFAYLEKAEC